MQLITPHVRFSYHTQHDNKNPWLDDIPQHRVKKDGYAWWPVRIHPSDAADRGINDGDIVKVYNDRGGVLGIAMSPSGSGRGLVHSYQAGAKYDPLEPGKAGSIDKGGCMNLLDSVPDGLQECARGGQQLLPGRNLQVGGIREMARYGMVIDITKCTGCYNCFLTCRDEFAGNDYPGYAAAQPMSGHELDARSSRRKGASTPR